MAIEQIAKDFESSGSISGAGDGHSIDIFEVGIFRREICRQFQLPRRFPTATGPHQPEPQGMMNRRRRRQSRKSRSQNGLRLSVAPKASVEIGEGHGGGYKVWVDLQSRLEFGFRLDRATKLHRNDADIMMGLRTIRVAALRGDIFLYPLVASTPRLLVQALSRQSRKGLRRRQSNVSNGIVEERH